MALPPAFLKKGPPGKGTPPPFAKKDTGGGGKTPGQFPIENEADLKKAIRLASTPKGASAKGYVKRRAAALNLSKLIPSDW